MRAPTIVGRIKIGSMAMDPSADRRMVRIASLVIWYCVLVGILRMLPRIIHRLPICPET